MGNSMKKKERSKLYLAAVIFIIVMFLFAAVFFIYKTVVNVKMSEETERRDTWVTETGDLILENEEQSVSIYEDTHQSEMEILQIIPQEVDEDNFTYYDTNVQERLEYTIEDLKSSENYTVQKPLAIWNPYGTGSNGLYVYFQTDENIEEVRYSIHTEETGGQDFEGNANTGDSVEKEFLIIGLVPGMENKLTIELCDENGTVEETAEFLVIAPDTVSGYDIVLEHKEGQVEEELTDGLYYTLGTQGYYGYMFFYDNDGILRYEMLLDGYKADRVLMDGDSMICCVSSNQIGRLDKLGRVTDLYTLEGYTMHHDFNFGDKGTLLVLATKNNTFDNRVMDRVLEIDMNSGSVTEVLDLQEIMPDYYDMTEKVSDTDPFLWQAGTRDWIHLNTIEYTEEDGLILSSRETSAVIKIDGLHDSPHLSYLIGDDSFWEGTGYEEYVFDKIGEFTPQYGQHTTTIIEDNHLADGQYLLLMYNNNYYANNTRTDGYEPDLDSSVSTELEDDETSSSVYVYLVDENAETYELVWSMDVPYSSIVSSVQIVEEHLVVNSGVAERFGEYDSEGRLIREFSYESEYQGYRVMKDDFEGYWFR